MRYNPVLFVGLILTMAAWGTVAAAADPPRRLILVSGESSVEVSPDHIALKLTVTTEHDDLLDARSANDKRVLAITKSAGERGVAAEQVQTDSFDIAAQYDKEQGQMRYKVVRTIDVQVRDMAKFEPLLADLLKLGGFKIASISLGNSQLDRHQTEARRQAYADAKRKAAQFADLDGVKLGKAVSMVVEDADAQQTPFVTSVIPVVGQSQQRGTPAFGQRENGSHSMEGEPAPRPAVAVRTAAYQADKKPAGKDAAATALAPGRITVGSSVTIQFEVQ